MSDATASHPEQIAELGKFFAFDGKTGAQENDDVDKEPALTIIAGYKVPLRFHTKLSRALDSPKARDNFFQCKSAERTIAKKVNNLQAGTSWVCVGVRPSSNTFVITSSENPGSACEA